MLSLQPKLVSRYADIISLLYKYGHSDLLKQAELPSSLMQEQPPAESGENNAGPEDLAEDLESRGPTYVKLGQLLSTRADILPPPYLAALTRLQDDVKAIDSEQVREIITEELGIRISRGFSEFDDTPLAAASLGQVHLASLRDGRKVAVKVQRPNVRQQVMTDLEAFQELAQFLDHHTEVGRKLGLLDISECLHDTLLEELDYRQEAENARTLGANLQAFSCIMVPQPIPDYCSPRVLTMEYVKGTKITDLSPAVLMEIDGKTLADELFRAYLHQVLVNGCFHSDPHPGNLCLTEDRRIALMDFGMVTRVSPVMQKKLLKLLLAICDGEGEAAAMVAVEAGTAREDFDQNRFTHKIATVVSANLQKSVEQIEAGRVVMDIQRAAGECGLRLPREITMLGKTLLNLDKVISTLAPEFDPHAALKQRATEIMQEQSKMQFSLSSVYQTLLETTELVQDLPHRANQFSKLLANNELTVKVDAFDEKRLMAGMQKIANRIAVGLILAALIIGASLMMQSGKTWMVVIATIFFLISAISGVILVFRVMFQDESHRPKS
jgi:ubiquinone biosynthesis protein